MAITDMKGLLLNILAQRARGPFKEFPNRIIYFREGVSESRLEQTMMDEMTQIAAAYQNAGKKPPSIIGIVLQKNHSTRFLPANRDDPNANLPPGTCIRDSYVHPGKFPSFYLIPHVAIKGTARPTRYFVIRNDLKVGMDLLQHFIYHLCYLFARATRSVSVPAPAYMAALLADRCRILCNMEESFSDTASTTSADTATNATETFLQRTNDELKRKLDQEKFNFYM